MPRGRRSHVVIAAVLLLAACSSDDPSTVEAPEAPATPPGTACLDPRSPQERPQAGWLVDDGTIVDGLPAALPVVESSPGLDALAGALVDALPAGFEVTDRRETRAEEGCALRRVVIARGADGAFVFVAVEQLDGSRSLFSVPLGAQSRRELADDGSETVTDDFDGAGYRHTALVATDDGLFVEAVAAGPNAPDLSGWPTTMAPPQGPQPNPGPAPLTIGELERLARGIADRSRQAG